jgi:CheY-like chemotaxis protein
MSEPGSKTILVVDDEPDVRAYIAAALEDAGFVVAVAGNGLDAYNVVKRSKPDLITLDLVMPRQSGVVFYKRLRANPKWTDIPVLVITAHARDDLGQEDFDELMKGREVPKPTGYLEKPVQPDKLVRLVANTLGVTIAPGSDEATSETRRELAERLCTADPETLRKIQELLERKG